MNRTPITPYQILPAQGWVDYSLIDCGDFEKLERFGEYVLRRPEPQAVWPKSLPESTWQSMPHASFYRAKGASKSDDKGEWVTKPGMPGQWHITYKLASSTLVFRLGLTAFKHVGLFPEQSMNWEYIYAAIKKIEQPQPKVLNLFAYTGGASLAAKAAGADVVHLDAVKPVVTWARENMDASKLQGIRWMVEDALKFVRREARRGSVYNGIILDPPAYGRGPEGEKWVLEEGINELFELCGKLLLPKDSFLVANLYSMGYSALIAENLALTHCSPCPNAEMGELYLPDKTGKKLPLGIFYRFVR